MEFAVLGRPPDAPALDLDHRKFAYAGKFVMTDTGKAVARSDGELLGAVAFNADRSDPTTAKIRYVTVRENRRGEGIGTRLLRFSAETLLSTEYETVVIAVNNPIAYRAAYRAGFAATGEQTGMAELLLQYAPDDRSPATFRAGLDPFRDRDLPPDQRACLEAMERKGVPSLADCPE